MPSFLSTLFVVVGWTSGGVVVIDNLAGISGKVERDGVSSTLVYLSRANLTLSCVDFLVAFLFNLHNFVCFPHHCVDYFLIFIFLCLLFSLWLQL